MNGNLQKSDFRGILGFISGYYDTRKTFDAFVCLAACALAGGTQAKECLEEDGQWKKEDLELFGRALVHLIAEMESRRFEDIFGAYYTESALSQGTRDRHGEFHMPKTICDLMGKMLVGKKTPPQEGPIAFVRSLGRSIRPWPAGSASVGGPLWLRRAPRRRRRCCGGWKRSSTKPGRRARCRPQP